MPNLETFRTLRALRELNPEPVPEESFPRPERRKLGATY